MISFQKQNYVLTVSLGFLSLCLFFVCLMSALGVWQLHRYHYKKTLLYQYQVRSTAAPKPFAEVSGDAQFERVIVNGTYQNAQTLLVQNQMYQNQVGYEVLTPLQIAGQNKLLLVDRGWVSNPKAAEVNVLTAQQITGVIKLLNEYQFILGKNILQPDLKPLVLQKIDLHDISQATHAEYYPFILRLDAQAPNGFIRNWTVTSINPERHLGYAVQWFVMAFVLLIMYLSFCIERVEP